MQNCLFKLSQGLYKTIDFCLMPGSQDHFQLRKFNLRNHGRNLFNNELYSFVVDKTEQTLFKVPMHPLLLTLDKTQLYIFPFMYFHKSRKIEEGEKQVSDQLEYWKEDSQEENVIK